MKLWKRNSIVVAIVLFVCAAVYLNWSYAQDAEAGKTLGEAALVGAKSDDPLVKKGENTGENEAENQGENTEQAKKGDAKKGEAKKNAENIPENNAESGYFSAARLNRQQARDSALSLLQEAAGDEKATSQTVEEANAAIQTMASNTLTEAQIENLITAKGYKNCVAFLSDNSISVVVPTVENGLTDADAAKIGEIVMEQTGLTADQVKIIPVEQGE